MTKEKLNQIITLDKIIESKLRQLDNLKATLYGLKSIVSDVTGVRGISIPNPTENAVMRVITLSEEINQDIDTLVDLKEKAAADIRRLDWKYRAVMEMRYMECLSWAEIAKIMGYGIDNVYRLHGKALKTLQ